MGRYMQFMLKTRYSLCYIVCYMLRWAISETQSSYMFDVHMQYWCKIHVLDLFLRMFLIKSCFCLKNVFFLFLIIDGIIVKLLVLSLLTKLNILMSVIRRFWDADFSLKEKFLYPGTQVGWTKVMLYFGK